MIDLDRVIEAFHELYGHPAEHEDSEQYRLMFGCFLQGYQAATGETEQGYVDIDRQRVAYWQQRGQL